MVLKPIDKNTPKDRPILAWCDHEADPYYESEKRLTVYGACCEGNGHVQDGFHVVEWGGGYDDDNAPEGPREWMPDWWFQRGSDFEIAANPVAWCELPPDWKKEAA